MKFVPNTGGEPLRGSGVPGINQVQQFTPDRKGAPYKAGCAVQVTWSAFVPTFLALFFMATASPAHAGVYKWVDEDGHAHYADQPPDKGGHTQLHIQVAPIKPQPDPGTTGILSNSERDAHQRRLDDANARLKAARDLEAANEKNRAEQRRIEDERAEAQKAIDDKRIAECKHNHEIYCDNGVEGINKAESDRNSDYEMRQNNAFRRGY